MRSLRSRDRSGVLRAVRHIEQRFDLQTKSESRIIISQIPQLVLIQLQTMGSFPTLSLLVLHRQPHRKHGGHNSTKQQRPKRNGIANVETRALVRLEDIARDDTTNVAESNLDRQSDSALIVPAEVVGKPNDSDGLGNVGSSAHEKDGHVPDAHAQAGLRVVWLCKRTLAQQDDVTDASHDQNGSSAFG